MSVGGREGLIFSEYIGLAYSFLKFLHLTSNCMAQKVHDYVSVTVYII